MAQKTISFDHVSLWTENLGDPKNPAILLIAGAGAHAHFWTDNFCRNFLEHGYFLIRYDHRDVGLSSPVDFSTYPYLLDDLAQDAMRILDSYGIEKSHVIGHSMGGYISQILALQFPERTKSITSISAGPIGSTASTIGGISSVSDEERGLMQKTWEILLSNRPSQSFEESLPGFMKVWQYLNGNIEMEKELAEQYTQEMFTRSKHKVGVHKNHVEVMKELISTLDDRAGILKKIKVPTLLIHGEEDNLVLPKFGSKALAEDIPKGKLVMIPGMGHMMFNRSLEDKIANIIINFIGSI